MTQSAEFEVLRALEGEANAFAREIRTIPEAELARPTRCGDWDIRTLLGHVVQCLERAVTMIVEPSTESIDPNPFIYYHAPARFDPARDVVRNSAAAESAARFSTGSEFADAVDRASAKIAEEAARLGPDVAVTAHWGPTMRLEGYLITRVVEVGVHGIDAADALNRAPWMTNAAEIHISRLLVRLNGTDLPVDLGWSTRDVVLAGTGRRALRPDEREVLGAAASAFPLIA